jgi:plastocyanin
VVFDTLDGEPADQAELDLPADGEATATLDAGAWAYHCGIHASMVGALTVEG